jgi:hypothetical protein
MQDQFWILQKKKQLKTSSTGINVDKVEAARRRGITVKKKKKGVPIK